MSGPGVKDGRGPVSSFRIALVVAVAALSLTVTSLAEGARPAPYGAVQRGLEGLVAAPGGPPGALATIHRGGRTTVLSAGRSDVRRPGRPRGRDHMRIASVAKAFSGAVALSLVRKGRLGLDETIGERLPALPVAWHPVTIRQLLGHTSGLPDYTKSTAFVERAQTNPRGYVAPAEIIDWVATDGLVFPPDSRYEYSNTDNIVVALIAEAATGSGYADLLARLVLNPARLTETSFDMRRVSLPKQQDLDPAAAHERVAL